jgi:hypothetical protein
MIGQVIHTGGDGMPGRLIQAVEDGRALRSDIQALNREREKDRAISREYRDLERERDRDRDRDRKRERERGRERDQRERGRERERERDRQRETETERDRERERGERKHGRENKTIPAPSPDCRPPEIASIVWCPWGRGWRIRRQRAWLRRTACRSYPECQIILQTKEDHDNKPFVENQGKEEQTTINNNKKKQ